ncbi:MAG: transglutaminase family protein [Acidimicrobiia bacterium]|nr:transglutaminase family protein [Acidimicrobiia bacterium]
MRLDIRYSMRFRYPKAVWESQNEVRVRPRDDSRQRVISHRLTTAPAARVMSFIDYWGTTVDHVGVREPHTHFEVIAEAAVEATPQPVLHVDPSCDELSRREFQLSMLEFLAPSAHTEPSVEIVEAALDAVAGAASVPALIDAVVDAVNHLLTYESGSTDIGISLPDLISGGKGVCQDYAHLALAMLRSAGVPARYVSGYLFAADETAPEGTDESDVVRVQTHAWVEAAVPGHGWYAVDPTNCQPVGDHHVVIGHGRDYDDVAPVRGVFVGSVTPEVDAEVVIERMSSTAGAVVLETPGRGTSGYMVAGGQRMQQQQ